MICPKCQHAMRTFDRNGIHLEQCENCRGIYLDNGELEQILLADRAQFQQAAVPQQAPPPYQPGPMPVPQHAGPPYAAAAVPGHAAAAPPPQSHKKKDDFRDDDDDDDDFFFGKSKDPHGKKKKKDRWGFLEELFD